jgi:hypothetical protein
MVGEMRVVRMEKSVERTVLAGEPEILGENLFRRHFVHRPGPPRWEASE